MDRTTEEILGRIPPQIVDKFQSEFLNKSLKAFLIHEIVLQITGLDIVVDQYLSD